MWDQTLRLWASTSLSESEPTDTHTRSRGAYLHLGAPSRIEGDPGIKMRCYQTTSTKVDTNGPNPDLREVQPRSMGGSQR